MTEPPKQLGPYTLDREIGRGGMGVVYLGHDTRLDRAVAIKSLPEHLAQDPVRLERFEREARTLASLNHPNVAGIHGIEEHEGASYLILEYVEGQELAELLDRGSLSLDEAVGIALQIAAGVEAAHEAGVIHRDLKPANIKITPDGEVKVLDFGLARAEENQSSTGMSEAATLTSPAKHSPTIPGVILGTAAYMSPEQARGRRVDKRTDIWSFGVILYEMLTGIGPFRGETATDSIGAILHKDINHDQLPPQTPFAVRRVISRCLTRDKSQRFRDIGDVALELQSAMRGSVDLPVQESSSRRSLTPVITTAVVASLVLGFVGLLAGRALAPAPPEPLRPQPVYASIPADFVKNDTHLSIDIIAITPDGSTIAYVANDPADGATTTGSAIFIRPLGSAESRKIPGTEGAVKLSISPDGEQIAYSWIDKDSGRQEFRRVNINGGPILTILQDITGNEYHIRWAPAWINNDECIIQSETEIELYKVKMTGGQPERIFATEPGSDWIYNTTPQFVQGSDWMLFNRAKLTEVGLTPVNFRFNPANGETEFLFEGAIASRVLPGDRMLIVQDGALGVVDIDPQTWVPTSTITPLIADLWGAFGYDIADNGTLVYVLEPNDSSIRHIISINRDGQKRVLFEKPSEFNGGISISPDGGQFLTTVFSENSLPRGLIGTIESGFLRPLSTTKNMTTTGRWMPDGRIVYEQITSPEDAQLFLIDPDIESVGRTLRGEDVIKEVAIGPTFSPDSRHMLFERRLSLNSVSDQGDIYYLDLESQEPAVPYIDSRMGEGDPQISPDGIWLAYRTYASGVSQIVLRPFRPGAISPSDPQYQVSYEGGYAPFWSNDGSELFFLTTAKDDLMRVQLISEPSFSLSAPELVLTADQMNRFVTFAGSPIDTLPGDEEFVYIGNNENSKVPPYINIAINWLEELDTISR